MRKIPTLFVRSETQRNLVTETVNPECQWVIDGEGVATRKFDGTCCMVRDGKLYKRYDAKQSKTPPPGFEPAQEPDAVTGHWPGWLLVGDGPDDRWHREAFDLLKLTTLNGHLLNEATFELVGPKIQGNPDNFSKHTLLRHGAFQYADSPRTFDTLRQYLSDHPIEGIVWHHPDGRTAKIKRRDFGLPWPVK